MTTVLLTKKHIDLFYKNFKPGTDILLDPNKSVDALPISPDEKISDPDLVDYDGIVFKVYLLAFSKIKIAQPIL